MGDESDVIVHVSQCELDNIDNEQLITLVQAHTVLYDTASHTNKNRVRKESAWEEIGAEIGRTGLWCSSQWTKLKAAYRKKKMLIGKSGQGRLRIEMWPHFSAMRFLDDDMAEASTSGNMDANGGLFSLESQYTPPASGTINESLNLTDDAQSNLVTVDFPLTTPGEPKKKKLKPVEKVDEEIIKFLNKPSKDLDSHDHFCKGIAEQLKTMSKRQSSLAKVQITKIMHDLEFGDIVDDE